MEAQFYPQADGKSRYYYPAVQGVLQSRVTKLVWHSTETSPLWDCPSYSGGTTAPTFTINPWKGHQKVWQHFPANMSAKALMDPSTTAVRENRDDVAQIEVIGYSQRSTNPTYWLPALDDDELAYIADVLVFYAVEWGTPLNITPLRWTWDAASNPNDPRYTGPQFDAFTGQLAHRHVSGNDHWDVSINIKKIVASAQAKLTRVVVPTPTPTPTPTKVNMTAAEEVWGVLLPNIATSDPNDKITARDALAQAYRQSTLGVNMERANGQKIDALVQLVGQQSGTISGLVELVRQALAGGGTALDAATLALIEDAAQKGAADAIKSITANITVEGA